MHWDIRNLINNNILKGDIYGRKYGSIIAIEPKSGEILALVNSPGYDPNLLVGRQRSSKYRLLNNDSIGKPLFERGLQGQYPPGSTFKIINALIGLQENVIKEKTSFRCDGGHFYAKNSFMKCHTKEATFSDLNNAIYTSCNTYFAKTYKGIILLYIKTDRILVVVESDS